MRDIGTLTENTRHAGVLHQRPNKSISRQFIHIRKMSLPTPPKPFDRFNKRLFQELLSPFGQVIPNMAVLGEERMIDIFFAPNPDTALDEQELGLLAKMVQRPALLEPFRNGLRDGDVTNSMMKLFMADADQQREHPTITLDQPPHLWILAAEVSNRLLDTFNCQLDPDYGDGFYKLAATGLRTKLVAIAELPTTPDTLWLRLLGKERTQQDAIAELLMLPETDPRRESSVNLLVSWRISIDIMEEIEREARDIQMALSQTYLDWERQIEQRGEQRGQLQARTTSLRRLLEVRYGEIDETLERLIPQLLAESDGDYMQLVLTLSKTELIAHFN
jgi:hypothetical protein